MYHILGNRQNADGPSLLVIPIASVISVRVGCAYGDYCMDEFSSDTHVGVVMFNVRRFVLLAIGVLFVALAAPAAGQLLSLIHI